MWGQAVIERAALPHESTSAPPVLINPAAAEGEWLGSVAYIAYDRAPLRSFIITVRQLLTDDGLTQASSVMPFVRCRRALSLTVTHALRPLKESAGPYFPPVAQVALLIVPLRPCPLT